MSMEESRCQEMRLGFGGCRAPEAPISVQLPSLYPAEAAKVFLRPGQASGSLQLAYFFVSRSGDNQRPRVFYPLRSRRPRRGPRSSVPMFGRGNAIGRRHALSRLFRCLVGDSVRHGLEDNLRFVSARALRLSRVFL
jgi:hypothetical protein